LEQKQGALGDKGLARQLSVAHQLTLTPEQHTSLKTTSFFHKDTDFFKHVVSVRLMRTPAMKGTAFLKGQKDFSGGVLHTTPNKIAATRPQAINEAKTILDLLETIVFADGRQWILKMLGSI
jgi:hypothetical protein